MKDNLKDILDRKASQPEPDDNGSGPEEPAEVTAFRRAGIPVMDFQLQLEPAGFLETEHRGSVPLHRCGACGLILDLMGMPLVTFHAQAHLQATMEAMKQAYLKAAVTGTQEPGH